MASSGSQLAARRVAEAEEGTTVRHVDQLSTAARRGLRALASGERRAVAGLESGEVVVTADSYLRVVKGVPAAAPTGVGRPAQTE